MAPEQVLDMKKCGAPADVFGLGATLFALLSGLPPFKGIVWTDPADPIHKSRPDISGWTAALIDRCLQKSPRKRYAGAEALLAALIECRESLGTAAPVDFTLQTVTAELPRRISTHPTVLDSDFRAETLRYETRQALFIAIPEAKEAKARQDWNLIVELLESLCADPVNADHPSKKIADGLLAKARAELTTHSLKKGEEIKRVESTKSIAALPAEHARPISVRALKELVLDLQGGAKLALMLLPAGEYMMGSPEAEQGRNKDELRHKVSISKPFYIGKFPVTQEQYDAIMGENPSQYRGGTLPVEGVAWDDGARFCAALSERTGKKLSLPSEAQWEYACRAGTATPFHFGTTLGTDLSNYDGHYAYGFGVLGLDRKKTTHAGTFKPNAFGLYDVHGNVWEWCRDFYHEHFYKNGPEIDPGGPATGKARVLRGGSWLNPPADCRSANRGRLAPNYRGANVGFRVAMESDD